MLEKNREINGKMIIRVMKVVKDVRDRIVDNDGMMANGNDDNSKEKDVGICVWDE
jgi:hypothetical protein